MDLLFSASMLPIVGWSLCVVFVAGLVKGVVGFALPMILISGLSTVTTPEQALAMLILPTLVTNGMQALRQGWAEAVASIKRVRGFLLIGLLALLLSAQLVAVLPMQVLMIVIGGFVLVFAAVQLAGWQPHLHSAGRGLELGCGAVAGFVGGLSGIWGPPTVLYLTAMRTEKQEQMRVQGVIYGLGAVALAGAHLGTGVLNPRTATLGVVLVPAAVLGMWLGGRLQDRIDQKAFRRATLLVLCLAGVNLLRRALF